MTKLLTFPQPTALFYQKIRRNKNIVYFSQKENLNDIKSFMNVNLSLLSKEHTLLFVKVFGEYYERVYNTIEEECLTLVDVSLIKNRMDDRDKAELKKYLLTPNFYSSISIKCQFNDLNEEGKLIDGVSYEELEANCIESGGYCFNRSTIYSVVNNGSKKNPFTGLPLSNTIIEEFTIPTFVILNDRRYNIRLDSLIIDDPELSDLTPLSILINLKNLFLKNSRVEDLSPLSSLTSLENLGISNTRISDLSPLVRLINLKSLELNSNEIFDLRPLAGLINLRGLSLNNNRIVNLEHLSNLPLENLHLNDNFIINISPLSQITTLKYLYLAKNHIVNLRALSSLHLVTLDLNHNFIIDISPISQITTLQELYLAENQIENLTPLSHLNNLVELELYKNSVVLNFECIANLPLTKLAIDENQQNYAAILRNSHFEIEVVNTV